MFNIIIIYGAFSLHQFPISHNLVFFNNLHQDSYYFGLIQIVIWVTKMKAVLNTCCKKISPSPMVLFLLLYVHFLSILLVCSCATLVPKWWILVDIHVSE